MHTRRTASDPCRFRRAKRPGEAMDPFSHVAFGRVLLRSHLRTRWRRGLAWAVGSGALAPDIDALLMPFAFDRYLVEHERLTHGLLGALICSTILAHVIKHFTRDLRLRQLVGASLVGSLSHLAADLLSGGTIRPFWPVSDVALFDLGLVAMGDLWVMAIFLAGMLVSRRRSPRAGLISALIVVATVGALFMFKATMRARAACAFAQADVRRLGPAQATVPVWGSLTKWRLYTVAGHDTHGDRALRVHTVDGWSGRVSLAVVDARSAASDQKRAAPAIDASREWQVVRNFHRAQHHLWLAQHIPRSDGSAIVRWSDLRYCWLDSRNDGPGSILGPAILCGLWFGGELDVAGQVQRQFVRFGNGMEQSR